MAAGHSMLRRAAWAFLVLALVVLWARDQARPWKLHQREYRRLERSVLEARRDSLEQRLMADGRLENLEAEVAGAREGLTERQEDVNRLEKELAGLERKARRVAVQLARVRGSGDRDVLRQRRAELEGLEEMATARRDRLASLRTDLSAAKALRDEATAPLRQARAELRQLDGTLGGLFRSAPFLWPFDPAWRIREIAPAGLFEEPPAPPAARLDRCTTCHLTASHAGYEADAWPAPFRGHPRLELFLGEGSPHPEASFGCTVCHGGEGRATDFSRAGHQPSDPSQEERWRREWGWRPSADPERAMWPLDVVEGRCQACHGAQALPHEAPRLSLGRELVTRLGCRGCHRAESPAYVASSAGPSLRRIASKTSAAWAFRWLTSPPAFRASTSMPHLFPSLPEEDPVARQRRAVEIRAIIDYLWESSQSGSYSVPPEGSRDRGEKLFGALGCQACHLLDGDAKRSEHLDQIERLHGPNLAFTGNKVFAGWLYEWLKAPEGLHPGALMPDMRLGEREAADLTAFLVATAAPEKAAGELPVVQLEVRDALLLAALEDELTLEGSQALLESMSNRERNTRLGEMSIRRHGCHGCHDIAGFEAAPPPAKPLGVALQGWQPQAALPHRDTYGFAKREASALRVALLGLRTEPVAAGRRVREARGEALAEGRRLISRHGCRGCHRIEGRGPSLPLGAGEASPPDLTHVGARLDARWMFDYLRDPSKQRPRPWLTMRMPAYDLSDEEINSLITYFVLLDDRPLMTGPPPPPDRQTLEVGAAFFDILGCEGCHGEGAEAASRAPDYGLARVRLRPRWVVDWILDPHSFAPGTAMPVHFQAPEGGLDASFLEAMIGAPMFRVQKERLERRFESPDELYRYLQDPERVAQALRSHIWTLRP